METYEKILALVGGKVMNQHCLTTWDIIKRFIVGWLIALGILILVSCGMHWDYITMVLAENTWSLIDALMPVIIIFGGIVYAIKSIFR